MEQSQESSGRSGLMFNSIKKSLHDQCKVMFDYALKMGKTIDGKLVIPLKKEYEELSQEELLTVFNYLSNLVKPAMPGTLLLFEKNRQSNSRFKKLGPLPIVRWFMVVAIISLFSLIAISLFPQVDNITMQYSMLQGSGWSQFERLMFLLAASSVGASFYALFKMNGYIQQGTFDMKYATTYWSRYVLGLVAGVLLSELFVVFIETLPANPQPATSNDQAPLTSAPYLIKPILAILGGFSANLVYRILNKLIDTVESLFKGSTDELIANKQNELETAAAANEHLIKSTTANSLLTLKQQLMDKGVSQDILNQVDQTLAQTIDIPIPDLGIGSTEDEKE
ncbi:hypothetical protein [Roseivirga sp. E12]|uniref:hypothetical protein n=1 Tax=Roseivirga sp. E12 TaxID=2819237 RepID=UPI001ABC0E97|nr:hypothetical protein [Roseivirga sp. E12]MBO3700418.1 hypothetical protein [Roseivirga sp. E12]